MTPITCISRLHMPGVLRDFRWPTDLPGFGRYNMIYGWNGTGKTSISRVLRALELQEPLPPEQALLRIGTSDVRGEDFASATTPVRVFNKDFCNEAVFPSGGGDVPPIFVVGKDSAEKQKQVDQLKSESQQATAELSHARSKSQAAENALDRFCIDRAGLIRDTLRSSGPNQYNNYNKTDFRTRVEQLTSTDEANAHRLTARDRDKLLAQHRATSKTKVPQVAYQIPSLQKISAEVASLLSASVVSKALAQLKDDPARSEWTRRGLSLHRERKIGQCLFCEQPLPSDRVDALEAHFSAEYENFVKRLEERVVELQATAKQAVELELPNKAEFYDDLVADFETAEHALRTAIEKICRFLEGLAEELTNRKGRPFDRLASAVLIPAVDDDIVDNINAVIGQHNRACDEFESRATDARRCLALDMVASAYEEFVNLEVAANEARSELAATEQKIRRLAEKILDLERGILEHRQPAEELNNDLRKYLGHDELHLEIKATGYTITRDGVPGTTLSEGETTAIALLYFLKSLRDRRFDLKRGVVVLDDPVSSLDANALYLAFGFIRERTKDAGQLFIFTHNFTFFRQVRTWFHHLKGQNSRDVTRRPARFYMMACSHLGGRRSSAIAALDPLLEQYESEYHYLFSRIYREASDTTTAGLEENYVLPNMARRVLEAFLAFRQPQTAGDLWQKLKDIDFDEAKKLRILRFAHTYSHGDTIGEPEHDPSLLGEARSVLRDLLDFIRDQDPRHFAAMEELVKPPEEEGGGA